MISHEKKLVFIHVPKTGGTTLSKFLLPYCDEESLIFSPYHEPSKHHARIIDYINYYGEDLIKMNYKFFCVGRNPYDRLLSMHFHQNNNQFNRKLFQQMLVDPASLSIWPHSTFHFACKKQIAERDENDKIIPGSVQTFLDFPIVDESIDGQIWYQMYVDCIHWPICLKFERFTDHVSDFFHYHGIKHSKDDLRKKTNTTDHKHYYEYLTQEELQYITWTCGLDFQILKYNTAPGTSLQFKRPPYPLSEWPEGYTTKELL